MAHTPTTSVRRPRGRARLLAAAFVAAMFQACGGGGGGGKPPPVDHARLDVCVLVGVNVADGCTTSGTDPQIQLGDLEMGQTRSRDVALYDGGDGEVAATVSAIALAPGQDANYALSIFKVENGVETAATLPFELRPGHGTELRVRVQFTANVAVGPVSGASLAVTTAHPAAGGANVAIVGNVTGCPAGKGDCDDDPANACETDIRTSLDHCGGCGAACDATNGTPSCADGVCGITCDAGFDNCDLAVGNGCETDLSSDAAHCGTCVNACSTNNGTASCTGSQCGIECTAGFADCDGGTNGCETDLQGDVQHCGACATACSATNGSPSCTGGACAIACDAGWSDCDGQNANGCESQNATDLANCGSCGNACSSTNGAPSCDAGTCTIACDAGFADCDSSPATGCEANLKNDPLHCGACGTACNSTNGTPTCAAGQCRIACDAGFADCDNDPTNGCEVNLVGDAGHCGGCGTACNATNGTPSCSGGACAIVCSPGYADCDGRASTGCEVNLNADASHCGACATACNATNGTPNCTAGICGISCRDGYGDCDGQASTGCEVNLNEDPAHCGACVVACNASHGTASCTAGVCGIRCDDPYADCDGAASTGCEVDLDTDPAHCGTCVSACSTTNGTPSCSGGSCAISCNAGFASCDGQVANGCEIDLRTDPAHCSACGAACNATNGTPSCLGSTCEIACRSGFANCDGQASNGCESELATDLANCGGCGIVCAPPNAVAACIGGACGFVACLPGFADCDGVIANGCEVNLAADPAHCGTCATACDSTNGTATCSGGACGIACSPGYGDCDGSVADGCETNFQTDPSNCSACGAACDATNGTPSCDGGSCRITCNSGFASCDGDATTGCEVNLAEDPGNCSACGSVCPVPANGTPACTGGTCGIAACNPGWGDCDGITGDGCETNTTNNVANCGACGTVCSAANVAIPKCSASTCAVSACATGWINLDGAFANGCECKTPTGSGTCASPLSIPTPTIGGAPVITPLDGVLTAGDASYYLVSFPYGGTPYISFARNDGGRAVFDVLLSCTSNPAGCGGTEAGGVTEWRFYDSWNYNYRGAQWPSTVIVRVKLSGASTSCATFQLRVMQ